MPLRRRDCGDVTLRRLLTAAGLAIFAYLASGGAGAAVMTLKDAIAKVEHDTGAKVLSAETKRNGKQNVYRIKVLTRAGQVKVIEVPAGE